MSWTDERVEVLRKMWEGGASASQIAEQLGGVSRNAVIGKVHRLQIKRLSPAASEKTVSNKVMTAEETAISEPVTSTAHDKSENLEPKNKKKKSSPASGEQADHKDSVQEKQKSTKNDSLKTANLQEESDAEKLGTQSERLDDNNSHDQAVKNDVVVPISRRLSLLQLTENTCKWPIGDPLSDDFHFCGAKTCEGSPYCSYHSKIAFQPLAERRRVRV